MRVGSLFSGYGGLDLAVEAVTGARTAWVSDVDKGACKILTHRFPDAPNLGDITKVDWSQVEPVDIVTGGFPCQDVSTAGKRAGMKEGTRTGLWSYMRDAIDQLRPGLVVAENVRGLLSAEAASDVEPCPWCLGDGEGEPALRALGAVLADLADIGYDAQWTGLRAADVGAPHGRFRVFVVAHPAGHPRRLGDRDGGATAYAGSLRRGQGWGAGPGEASSGGARSQPAGRGLSPAPDAEHDGRATATVRRGISESEAEGGLLEPEGSAADAWGIYAPAIARWEQVLGRPAPAPLRADGKHGAHRLNPAAVEFMMGLPAGWVMDVPGLTRSEQLKAFGNGVVWQQAAAGLTHLLATKAVAA